VTRPPASIQLECNLVQQDGTLETCPEIFSSRGWTDAWEHQNVTHSQQTVRWSLTAGD